MCFLAGFVDSIAGGGGIISLPAFFAVGLPSHIAIGTNKIQSTIGTIVSASRYFIQGYVNIKLAIPCAILAIAGSAIGSNLVLIVEDWILKILLIVLLPIVAFFVLRNKGVEKKREEFSFVKTLVIACICAFFIGVYDGFYGPGTGTFLILLFTIVGHMTLENANGLAKATNLASNVGGAVVFLINGVPLIALAVTAGLFNSVGTLIGTKMFINKGVKVVKPIMIVVLILLFAKVLYDTFF
ncbi:MAG: TSUP family transporter [Coriobacteriales bacterium]|nr:TSUP family transporter [Coriobacteriales bacterium]